MKKIIYSSLLILCMTLASCGEDFLNRSPISNMNEVDFYNSENDMNLAIAAAYATLHDIYAPHYMLSYYGELMSDNVYTANVILGWNDRLQFQDGNVRADNNMLHTFWNAYYTSMYRINNVISRLHEVDDISNANGYEAEMRFLRALYYFDLVRAWNNVPIVTTPLSLKEAYATPLSSSEDVYKQIIEDLNFAVANLGETPRQLGAPTIGAANTLLGKVYLTQGNKTEAATTLLKVYGKYSLVPYADLWDLKKKNSAESIFEIQYTGGAGNPYSLYWAYFTPYENGIATAWGYGDNQVSDDLWDAYEENDIRRDISIYDGYIDEANADTIKDVRFAKKWVDRDAQLDNDRHEMGDNNFIVLRYADVLLLLTEATGDAKYLNEVRARAELLPYGDVGYPTAKYNTIELAVEHERQVEFALEFHRFFDLKRTGRAVEVLKNIKDERKISSVNNADLFGSRGLYLPIPLPVLDQNPILKQNNGY
ncbi:hypothetical protein EZS27_011410 [termite gut metagenome]|uniref:RagB/SusD family nutrient uptake outer membrane protein n=1 Tax=termite gut metagenome TaxID=433724 RepID=A0A5J4S5Y3_9ZZZZ